MHSRVQRFAIIIEKCLIPFSDYVALRTQHSTEVVRVDSKDKGKGMSGINSAVHADALLTTEKHLGLFLLTADCLPIIFFDEANEALCLAHVSKENMQLKFVQKIVDTFIESFHSDPRNLLVAIGPGIHHESYDIDLVAQNIEQLTEKKISGRNISISPVNTFTSKSYFSHRRAKLNNEREGRFATVAMIE